MRRGFNTLLLLLVWGALIAGRSHWIRLDCNSAQPSPCQASSVWLSWDRSILGEGTVEADLRSYATQNATAWLAVGGAVVASSVQVASGGALLVPALLSIGADLITLTQVTALNGILNEGVRAAVQRPRPFVYRTPGGDDGREVASYTSMYSGHTSFAALATILALSFLATRRVGRPWILLSGAVGVGLTIWTAVLRVQAGKHFPTDTVIGGLAGAGIALLYLKRYRVADFVELCRQLLPSRFSRES